MSPYFKNRIEQEMKTVKDLVAIREVRLSQRITVPSKSLFEQWNENRNS
jgi:hypothetical protein